MSAEQYSKCEYLSEILDTHNTYLAIFQCLKISPAKTPFPNDAKRYSQVRVQDIVCCLSMEKSSKVVRENIKE